MRPPDCYVCHLMLHEVPDDGRDYFTLVRFGATEDAKMAPTRALEAAGRAGHPRNAIWFCNEHLPLGREHADRDLDAALDAIKADPRYLVRRKGPTRGPGSAGHQRPFAPGARPDPRCVGPDLRCHCIAAPGDGGGGRTPRPGRAGRHATRRSAPMLKRPS
jgi:hypothetical protein